MTAAESLPSGIHTHELDDNIRPQDDLFRHVHAKWIADVSQLTLDALQPVWPLQPRILLVGTAMPSAASLRALRAPLAARDVALEVMDLGAACRTYNVLAQENRPVLAALFPQAI